MSCPQLTAPIAWLGRQGTWAIAVSLFLGMALPSVSALAKPALPVSVFFLLVLAMIRIEPDQLKPISRRPFRLFLMLVWCMAGVPTVFGGVLYALGLFERLPEVGLGIILMLCAPPIMSVAAFCAILRLNDTLSFLLMVLTLVVTPITAPFFAAVLARGMLPLSSADLALGLTVFLAGSAIIAAISRRLLGAARIASSKDLIDGLNVILLFVFAVALMDGVAVPAFADPGRVAGLIALSFGIAGGILGSTTVLFHRLGVRDALSAGLTCCNRNMGLMGSVMISTLPDPTWTYLALAQFPIYLLPLFMRPLVRFLGADQAAGLDTG